VTAPSPRHAAPDVGFDPSRDPGCIRAAWIASHGLRHLPDRIRSHRYVQVCEVAR
jgi:hypothetical protein